MGVLGGGRKAGKVRVGRLLVLDFTSRSILLPNGDMIRREDIISFDPLTGTLVYRDPVGTLKSLRIEGEGDDERVYGALARVLEKIAGERKEERSNMLLHV